MGAGPQIPGSPRAASAPGKQKLAVVGIPELPSHPAESQLRSAVPRRHEIFLKVNVPHEGACNSRRPRKNARSRSSRNA